MTESLSFHLWLRSARRSLIDPDTGRRMTQRALAAIIGCHKNVIYKAEAGKHVPCFIIRKELFKILPATEPLDLEKVTN